MKPPTRLLCCVTLAIGASGLQAQTAGQPESEGAFVRALIRAEDAGDCHLALRLIDARRVLLAGRAPARAQRERMYLAEQVRDLEDRRAILRRECR